MRNTELDLEMDNRFREVLNDWAAAGSMSQEYSTSLKENVNKLAEMERKKKRPLLVWISSITAAAVLLAVLIVSVPQVRTWAAENIPIINKYIAQWTEIEKGWEWAEEHDMFQEILVSTTDKGYTVNIHKVLADPIKTTVFYSLEGSSPKPVNWGHFLFNDSLFVTGMGARGDIINGTYVGSIVFDPLPENSGELTLIIDSIGEVKGNWHISFPVTREPLSHLTNRILIEEDFAVPKGTISVEELRLSPTQTELILNYHGYYHGPDLSSRFVTLSLDGKKIESAGGGGQGTRQEDGTWKERYQLHYQPLLRLSPDSVVIVNLSGLLFNEGETRVPLKGNRTGYTPDGRKVEIVKLDLNNKRRKAVISVEVDGKNPDPFAKSYWQVIDDEGNKHITELAVTEQSESTSTILPYSKAPEGIRKRKWEINWNLPTGRTPEALVNMGFWAFDNIGTVNVKIPQDLLD